MICSHQERSNPLQSCSLRIASAIVLLAATASSAVAEKIFVSSDLGDATVIQLVNPDGEKAQASFQREQDDVVDFCVRQTKKAQASTEVQRCTANASRDAEKVMTRRAFCSRLTIYTEFGNFSMVNHEIVAGRFISGKPAVRTDWKNHVTAEIVRNCQTCRTPEMLDTLRVLCPITYDNMFHGVNPY